MGQRRRDGGRGRLSAGFAVPAMAVGGITMLVLSCGDAAVEPLPPPDPVAATVTVNPSSATLATLGETARFTAEVRDQNGQVMTGTAVAWTSSDASIAAVDASGLVTAAGNGSATITAAAGSVSGTAAVTVAQTVSAVTVTPPADTLVALGDTVRLVAEAVDANGHAVTGAESMWASSDTLVATVEASGLVTAAGNGTATITATSGTASGSTAVTVAQTVSAVTVTPPADTLVALGDTVRLVAEAVDANGHAVTGAEFAWASSDTRVATVEASGLVTAAGNGTATITATSGTASGSAALTVDQVIGVVTVSPSADTLVVGGTLRLSAQAHDANGYRIEGAEFLWASGDTEVATVDPSGQVTAVGAGEVEVTATSFGVSGRARVTVKGFTLVGTVTDGRREGLAIPGATVRLAGGTRKPITTDRNGRYRLSNISGKVRVTVTADPSYLEQTAEVTVESDRTLDFVLRHTGEAPYGGTVWVTPDILGPADPTSLRSVTYTGRGMRETFDRRVNRWVTVEAYLFDAQFGERTVEFQVNLEFGSREAARAQVDVFAPALGRLPAVLMSNLRVVHLQTGEGSFGGNSYLSRILIHPDGRHAKYAVRNGFLEEVFIHEAAHVSLDPAHADSPGWRRAQRADGAFISDYARDYPDREDVAESILPYFAVRYRPHRLSPRERWFMRMTIPNRVAYFDEQDLDMSPYARAATQVPVAPATWTAPAKGDAPRFEDPPIPPRRKRR